MMSSCPDAMREGLTRRAGNHAADPPCAQPLPSVEPALDFADLLDELDASVRPALLSDALEGFPDDRDDDFAIGTLLPLDVEGQITRARFGVAKAIWNA